MKKASVHPMIEVPDAIRMALTEAAKVVIHWQSKAPNDATDEFSTHDFTQLHGRILAHDVVMRHPGYPPYAASVMDGLAVNSAASTRSHGANIVPPALSNSEVWTHAIRGKVLAGDGTPESDAAVTATRTSLDSSGSSCDPKNLPAAYYITTGAVIPSDCDCVVPIEDVLLVSDDQTRAKISPASVGHAKNKWIRAPGCDIAPDTTVLTAGSVLDPVALGLLLQTGVTAVRVWRTITVGVLSTGSELLTPHHHNSSNIATTTNDEDWWTQLPPGTIPDVNRPVLMSLLAAVPNVNVVDLGMVRDDAVNDMVESLRAAAQTCDVILTTGGISQGETDRVEHVLVERLRGQLHFGRLHMKPGKPTTLVTLPPPPPPSQRHDGGPPCLVFALPGNPVSAVVCAHLLVIPCLHLLTSGGGGYPGIPTTTTAPATHGANLAAQLVGDAYVHAELTVSVAHDIKLDFERPEYHRVTLDRTTMTVTSTGVQQSSRLLSLRDAHGLLVLPQATAKQSVAAAGTRYPLLLLPGGGGSSSMLDRVRVRDSQHLAKRPNPPLRIGIVQVATKETAKSDIDARVAAALNGSQRGAAVVAASRVFSDPVDRFFTAVAEEEEQGGEGVDILVVACVKVPGAFRQHAKLACLLRRNLAKVADAMALQARRGAASQDATAALFEVVIGYRSDGRGCVVVLLPEHGLDAGLANVRGLLKHALRTARGVAAN